MVREITGDLLSCDADVICHQVNYYGVMGGGIAAAIRRRVLTDSQYSNYQRLWLLMATTYLAKYNISAVRRIELSQMFSVSAI